MYGAVCVRCTLSVCALFVEQSEDTGCLRAAPLLRGLVLKSGHEHVFPPSFHLPLHPPLSFCLLAPSFFFYLSAPAHSPTLPPATVSFWYIFCLHAAECKAEASARIPLLSGCISPLSILLSLYAFPLCFSLSMLISVIRLWGISWD